MQPNPTTFFWLRWADVTAVSHRIACICAFRAGLTKFPRISCPYVVIRAAVSGVTLGGAELVGFTIVMTDTDRILR